MASQVTALEIWLIACIFLVFGALAEYAFILRKLIRLSRLQQNQQAIGGTNGMIDSPTGSALRTGGVDPLRGDWQEQTLDSLQVCLESAHDFASTAPKLTSVKHRPTQGGARVERCNEASQDGMEPLGCHFHCTLDLLGRVSIEELHF